MPNNVENNVIENQEVASANYPGIELVDEYVNPNKPAFEWNSKDNLIVCLKFSDCLPFPETIFQRFIVERQGDAFWLEVEIESESQRQFTFFLMKKIRTNIRV